MLRKVVHEFEASKGPTFSVRHDLGTRDVIVQTYDIDTGETFDLDVAVTGENDVTLTAIGLDGIRAFRVVIVG